MDAQDFLSESFQKFELRLFSDPAGRTLRWRGISIENGTGSLPLEAGAAKLFLLLDGELVTP